MTTAEIIASTLGSIGIGGSLIKGADFVSKKKKVRDQKRREENQKKKDQDDFISRLPATIDSLVMNASQVDKMAEVLSKINSAIDRLEKNQIEARELRRIEANQLNKAYYRCRPNGRCYEVSQALCEIFGMSEQDMLSNDGSGWISGIENPSESWSHWISSIKDNLPYEDSYVVVNRSKKPITKIEYVARAWPVRGIDGQIQSFYGTVSKKDEN